MAEDSARTVTDDRLRALTGAKCAVCEKYIAHATGRARPDRLGARDGWFVEYDCPECHEPFFSWRAVVDEQVRAILGPTS